MGIFRECLLHDDRLFQMILVAAGALVFDCYVQRVLIQMGLLKLIKYSMFDGAVLNGIVDGRCGNPTNIGMVTTVIDI